MPIIISCRIVLSININFNFIFLIPENNFICECRLRWIFDLHNHTKNDDLRRSLEKISCYLDRTQTALNDHNQQQHFNYKINPRNNPIDFDFIQNELNNMPIQPRAEVIKEVVTLFSLNPNHLPCEQVAEPTELPLQRESVGMDFVGIFKSSGAIDLYNERIMFIVLMPFIAAVLTLS